MVWQVWKSLYNIFQKCWYAKNYKRLLKKLKLNSLIVINFCLLMKWYSSSSEAFKRILLQWLNTRERTSKFYAWPALHIHMDIYICIFSDWSYQTTWPQSTDCYLLNGWQKFGDLIHFSKMPRVSLFKQWLFLTTIYGFTKTSQFSTWSSKCSVNSIFKVETYKFH